MNTALVKALTRRIQDRYGSNRAAALAADVSPSVWSGYCSDDQPTLTLPFHRLLMVANAAERRAFADVLMGEGGDDPGCLSTEASEATEATAALQRTVRLAAADGDICAREAREIVREAVAAQAEIADVIRLAGRAA